MELKIAAQPPLFLPIADAKDYVWRIVIFFTSLFSLSV